MRPNMLPNEQPNINAYECIRVSLASPETIRSWSHGEVTKPETINYRSLKPERDGLFCARIFGPVNDWECLCGKYKRQKFKGVTCDKCGVEVTKKAVRRERMGHIQLASPVSHVWFFKGVPSRIGYLLDLPLKDLEKVLYFEAYVVIDVGDSGLKEREILTEDRYRDITDTRPEGFKAMMGAEAIKELLKRVDVEALAVELRDAMKKEVSAQKRTKIAKRVKIAEAIKRSGNKCEWMILDVIPVLPPELRPLVPLDGGRFATSDLNDLYRRVINRNNRLKKLLDLRAPEVIVRNEKRMLQEAADALFENGKRGRPLKGVNNRTLKSLSDALKGKQGRFRQNLLGKRVDYSGRSVIVVGPDLKLHQCGLPKKMALELFKPFIFNRLEHKGFAATIRQAKEMVERGEHEVWDVLDEVIQNHPILLNRAPTLHRLGIQAFQPILVEGKAIRLHPLVCTAFNADFDGDQMAVHVPLSPMAQIEAKVLMMSTQNILNPANGKPNVVPSQDIVLGGYYLTKKRVGRKGEGMVFGNIDQVIFAHEAGVVDTHSIISLRYSGDLVDTEAWHRSDPKKRSEQEVFECPSRAVENEIITTTVGRIIFNRSLPKAIPFVNGLLKKEGLLSLVNRAYKFNGPETTILMLDALKDMGFLWAMKAGVSVGIDDLVVPKTKPELLRAATEEGRGIEHDYYDEGKLDASTRTNRILEVWSKTADQVASDMMKELEHQNDTAHYLNSIFIMADSGARGSKTQIRQVAGMRGLMAKPSGDIIETPIRSNFKEGLTVLEYFTSTHGARKGLADTALKTADSGYLTRKLVDVAQDVIINEDDCGTIDWIEVAAIVNSDGTIRARLRDRIMGRVVAEDVVDPYSKKVIAAAGTLITEDLAFTIETSGIQSVRIRSILTCESRRGVCASCYGLNLSTGRMVDLGEAVGTIAAQSIGEPGTQLTMRTFHVGGAASRASEKNLHEAQIKGVVKLDGIRYVENRHGEYVALSRIGNILVLDQDGNERERYKIAPGATIRVKDGESVEPKTVLAEWDPYNDYLINEKAGMADFKEFELNVSYQEEKDQITGRFRKRIIDAIDDRLHPHINVMDDDRKVLQRYNIPTGAYMEVESGNDLAPGDVLAKTPRQQAKTLDITGGLPRVTELFEGRKPKELAIISKVTGTLRYGNRVRGNQKVVVEGHNGEREDYLVPRGKHIQVQDGDEIHAGEKLTEGAVSPHDILEIHGEKALQAFLLNEVQEVYRAQGVTINDKHIEVIIRQMMRWVQVTDVGDTPLIVEEKVDKHRFKEINERAIADGGTPATCEPQLLGITKAALTSESFISAASFQETARVLTEAALEGRIDYLRGLKENVILGRLIPAGTGLNNYRNLHIEEGQYPEPVELVDEDGDEFDDEYSRMAVRVEELQGLTEADFDQI
jgi:DNA-directed RNA polymerase subunit beta'